jgi:hypothetical protein
VSDDFAEYAAQHAIPLKDLDPDAPLDDLEPLADSCGPHGWSPSAKTRIW